MAEQVPRLRMFAGPNGSGKSTLKTIVKETALGVYLNPDEVAALMSSDSGWHPNRLDLPVEESEFMRRLAASPVLVRAEARGIVCNYEVRGGGLFAVDAPGRAYLASAVVEACRYSLMKKGMDFSIETVMSHPDKVALLEEAQQLGYRTYLYFVATEDPTINLSRIANRVRLGGHDVPADKVVERYTRSLALLPGAIQATNRAYIFDNSADGEERIWVAGITDGADLDLRAEILPRWFKRAVLDVL